MCNYITLNIRILYYTTNSFIISYIIYNHIHVHSIYDPTNAPQSRDTKSLTLSTIDRDNDLRRKVHQIVEEVDIDIMKKVHNIIYIYLLYNILYLKNLISYVYISYIILHPMILYHTMYLNVWHRNKFMIFNVNIAALRVVIVLKTLVIMLIVLRAIAEIFGMIVTRNQCYLTL